MPYMTGKKQQNSSPKRGATRNTNGGAKKDIKILAIETSCDETAASILVGDIKSKNPKFQFLSSVVKTQIDIHKKTGGVVPEVAAREHMANILPVTEKALLDAKLELQDLDYLAVTSGPGLVVSLIVGTEFAKGLSLATGIPLLPTNHMAGHLYSAFSSIESNIETNKGALKNKAHKKSNETTKFPILSIIVSGGHTLFILMRDYKNFKVIGSTIDDAAGEAFDKVARLLKLPYPGGPEISKLALQGKEDLNFPRPMLNTKNFDFSFSGLKTSVLYYIESITGGNKQNVGTKREVKKPRALKPQEKADIAMSFENAVVDVLVKKALRAVEKYKCSTIALSGGVAANRKLRAELAKMCNQEKLNFIVPDASLCTDNAQMIALAAYFNLRSGIKPTPTSKIKANPAWELN